VSSAVRCDDCQNVGLAAAFTGPPSGWRHVARHGVRYANEPEDLGVCSSSCVVTFFKRSADDGR
jgi:hypothetical protein